jgi:hypothetical protein
MHTGCDEMQFLIQTTSASVDRSSHQPLKTMQAAISDRSHTRVLQFVHQSHRSHGLYTMSGVDYCHGCLADPAHLPLCDFIQQVPPRAKEATGPLLALVTLANPHERTHCRAIHTQREHGLGAHEGRQLTQCTQQKTQLPFAH